MTREGSDFAVFPKCDTIPLDNEAWNLKSDLQTFVMELYFHSDGVLRSESFFQSSVKTMFTLILWIWFQSMWAATTSWALMLKKIGAVCVEGTAAPVRQQKDSLMSLYPEEVIHNWLQAMPFLGWET